MSRTNTTLRNISWNLGGFAAQAVVLFFLTPYVLHNLGDIRYGLWILMVSITGHYGLLSLGIRGGLSQYLTRYLSSRDYQRMNDAASTAFVILSFVGLAVIGVAMVMAFTLPAWVKIPEGVNNDIFWSLLIIGVSSGIQMPFHVYEAVFPAAQRFDITNIVAIATRLISAGFIFASISLGYGLIGLSLSIAITDIIGHLLRWKLAYQVIPELKVSFRFFNKSRRNEMMSYGIWSFVISIAASIFVGSDAIVISAIMPVAAVAFYALAAGLVEQLEGALRRIDRVFFPLATALDAKGERELLRELYLKGTRLILLAMSIVAIPASLWAADFYRLWVGKKYVQGGEFASVAVLFHVLLVAMIFRLLPVVGGQTLQAIRRVKPLALLAIAEAGANLAISIILAFHYGLVGVAIGTVASVFLFRTVIVPWMIGSELGVSLRMYFTESLLRPLLVTAVLGCLLGFYKTIFTSVESFPGLALDGVIAGILGIIVAVAFGLRRDERQQYLFDPLRRVRTRWSADLNGND